MKRAIYLLIFCSLVFTSCKREEISEYKEEKPSVYFGINPLSSVFTDTARSFTIVLTDTLKVELPVRISGVASEKDRYFKVEVNKLASTALEGTDFKPLLPTYKIPAGSYKATVPVILKRTKILQDTSLKISLVLKESDDFSLGEKKKLNANLSFSDRLIQPSNWSTSYFKVYSRKKHSVFLILTGREEYPNTTEFSANFSYYSTVVARALSKYFKDNYPVLDERNQIIEPW